MSKFSVAMKRFGGFLKRNAFYFLIVLCIASVATVIALAVTRNNVSKDANLSAGDNQTIQPEPDLGGGEQNKPQEEDKKPEDPPAPVLTFKMPCTGTMKVEYAHDQIIQSSTFGHWATHEGIDFVSDDLNIYASADGVVKEVDGDALEGNYVVIEHADGYVTVYKSLADMCALKVGAKVTQGQLLGQMSISQGEETAVGPHLHFEVWKNGESVNPLDVLLLEEK